MFMILLSNVVNACSHTKCVSLISNAWFKQLLLIYILINTKYTQGLRCYPLAVNLDKCVANCNTLNDLSNIVCILNKTQDLRIHVSTLFYLEYLG